jgi:hypothetical protein
VTGQIAVAEAKRGHQEGRHSDEPSLLSALEEKRGAAETAVARAVIDWARGRMPRFA